MRRVVVVQPYTQVIIHDGVVLLCANFSRPSVPEEDIAAIWVRAELQPVGRILQRLVECHHEPVVGSRGFA